MILSELLTLSECRLLISKIRKDVANEGIEWGLELINASHLLYTRCLGNNSEYCYGPKPLLTFYVMTKSAPSAEWCLSWQNTEYIIPESFFSHPFCWWIFFYDSLSQLVGKGRLLLWEVVICSCLKKQHHIFFFFKLSSTSNFNSFTPEEKILVVIERFPAINLYCIFNSQYCTFLLEMRVRLTHTLDWVTRLPWRVNPHILGRRGRKEFDDDTTQWLGKIATGFLVEAWQYFVFTYPEATNLTISINAFLVDKKGRQFAIWK